MSSSITVISETPVYKATYFDVSELLVELPNKNKKTYGVVHRKPAIYAIPITENKEIHMVSQDRFMLKKTTLELVAGFIEDGEDSLDAAKRELMEEAGIKGEDWSLLTKVEMSGSVVKSTIFYYVAKNLTIAQSSPEEDEKISVVTFPIADLVSKVVAGEIDDMGSMLGILLVNKLQLEGKL